MPPGDLRTHRLRLTPLTASTSAAAARGDVGTLARLLGVRVPPEWPPIDLADVQGLLAEKLAAHPEEAGWWGWYVILESGPEGGPELIGSAGCTRWGSGGTLHFGYGLLPAFFGRGLATEAATALMAWVVAQPGVDRVEATTFERHRASVKILQRCGFVDQGVSPGDGDAAESDRQGRGALHLFVWSRSPASGASA